jgi:hypothetical protein
MVAVTADLSRLTEDEVAALRALLADEFRRDRYVNELIDGQHWRITTVVLQVSDGERTSQ